MSEAEPVEMRNVECGRCGEALIRDGEMLRAFAVPADRRLEDILCESCARRAGVWEEA